MKFLFISTAEGLPWGGSECLWTRAAEWLLDEKHQVAFSYKQWDPVPETLRALETLGAEADYREESKGRSFLARLRNRLARSEAWLDRPAGFGRLSWVTVLYLRHRPDLVCINVASAYDVDCLAAAMEELHAERIPVVVISQLESEWTFMHESRRDALRRAYASCAATVFVSAQGRALLERQLASRVPNSHILQNPANSTRRMQPWRAFDESIRFACVAHLNVYHKAQDKLLEALAGPDWRDRRWQLSLYGQGPHESLLQELVRMYDLGDRVVFHGHVGDVDAVWREEDICVLVGNEEGTPLALMEAMYAGRPAVVTDVGGQAEWIRDEINGWVAPGPSVGAIARALEAAWRDKSRWRDMGAAARRVMEERGDPDPGRTLADLLLKTCASPAA